MPSNIEILRQQIRWMDPNGFATLEGTETEAELLEAVIYITRMSEESHPGIPLPVLVALRHVQSVLPDVDRVVFFSDGRWCYLTEEHEVPKFPDGMDISILEQAADSVLNLPAVFELFEPVE